MTSDRTRRLAQVALPVLAAAMLLTIFLPAELWRSPEVDGSYQGFDPVLMYMDPAGNGDASGSIDITEGSLALSALPGSEPTVHLATSPLSYTSSFVAVISKADPGSMPLSVSAWAPYANLSFSIVFESEPSRRVLLQRTRQGQVIDTEPLGIYQLDQEYMIRAEVDRATETIRFAVNTPTEPGFQGQALLVEAGSIPFGSHVISDVIAVSGSERYTLKASTRSLQSGPVGVSIEWLDFRGERIGISDSWENRQAETKWSGIELTAKAPPNATAVRVEVATDGGSSALFSDVSLSSTASDENLIVNGDFSSGTTGWRRAEGAEPLATRSYGPLAISGTIDSSEWPEVFESTRLAVSVSSSADTGLAVANLSAHSLDLAHDRWLAVKVRDGRLTALVLGLGALGAMALVIGAWGRRRESAIGGRALVLPTRRDWALVSIAVIFILGNMLLARVGSFNADVIGARTWGYTVSTSSPDELYFSSNVASIEAEQWSGRPLQEAGFPYGPTMAYVTTLQGLTHRLVFNMTGLTDDADSLIVLAKFSNTLFALAAGGLIYLILKRSRFRRSSVVVALAFLLNPAVWFAGSVWGSSQAVSLLVLLLALYFAQRDLLTLAWAFNIAALLTRPQYVVPVILLGLLLIRQHKPRDSIAAISKAVVGLYVLFLPLWVLVSPTLPVDNLVNAFFLHVGSGNDGWTLPLSWGGLSIWTLVSPMFLDLSGIDRVLFPAETTAILGLTFHQLGTLLAGGAVASLCASALRAKRRGALIERADIVLAAATMAFFTLNTATPTYHYVLPLALIIAARPSLPSRTYWFSVLTVTATTFVSMYAMGAYWLTRHPTWAVGIYSESNAVSSAFAALAEQDWYITVGAAANLVVVLLLMTHALAHKHIAHINLAADGAPLDGDEEDTFEGDKAVPWSMQADGGPG